MSLWIAALFIAWLMLVVFARAYRIWLPYYVLGAAGMAYWLALIGHQVFQLEILLAQSIAWAVHGVSGAFDVPTRVFDGAPGVLMVMVVSQQIGWTMLQIGVESSGLLEMSVLVSLLAFYPGWSLRRRALSIAVGLAATWSANTLRMVIITCMLSLLGKDALILAHTFVGKAVFFLLTIGIYWYLITAPTVYNLGARGRAQHAKI